MPSAISVAIPTISDRHCDRRPEGRVGAHPGASDRTGTLVATVFTLVVCLVVVGLSGAAVLYIVLSDAPQRATLREPTRRDGPPPVPEASVGDVQPVRLATAVGGYELLGGSRLRSATRLLLLLVMLGVVLAGLVVLGLVVAARALQGALG